MLERLSVVSGGELGGQIIGGYNLSAMPGVSVVLNMDSGLLDVTIPNQFGPQTIFGVSATLDRSPLGYSYAPGQAITLLAPAVAGIISASAIVGLFVYIFLRFFNRSSGHVSAFNFWFGTPMGACLLSQFLADLLGSAGWAMGLKWVVMNEQYAGSACTFQGVAEQTSTLGSAVWSAYLSTLTFFVLVLGVQVRMSVLWGALAFGWVYIAVVVAAGPLRSIAVGLPASKFWGPLSPWCYVNYFGTVFLQQGQEARHFIILTQTTSLFSAAISLASYVAIYVKLAGPTSLLGRTVFGQNSVIDTPSHNGHLSTKGPAGGKVAEGRTEDIGRQVNSICRKLLLYPTLYTIVVTPICVVRMYTGTHDLFKAANFPWGVIVFASTVEALSGLFNVVLFWYTRNALVIRYEKRALQIQVATTHYAVSEAAEDFGMHDPNYKTDFKGAYPLARVKEEGSVRGGRGGSRVGVERFGDSEEDLKDLAEVASEVHSLNYSQSTINNSATDQRHLLR